MFYDRLDTLLDNEVQLSIKDHHVRTCRSHIYPEKKYKSPVICIFLNLSI